MGDGARVERWERRAEWPLTGLAALFLGAYAWPIVSPDLPDVWSGICRGVSWIAWFLFAVDYGVRLVLSESRSRFVSGHLADLAVIALPLLRPLRPTVGYGDEYPVTTTGRLVAGGLMVAGIALLGVVTASLASWLVERVSEVEEESEAATRRDIAALQAELTALRRELAAGRPVGLLPTGEDSSAGDSNADDSVADATVPRPPPTPAIGDYRAERCGHRIVGG
jgi:hypothetical protein